MTPRLYSLRTGILFHLTFLIICAMLLINVVMVKFSERDLIRAKVHTGRLLIQALEQNIVHLIGHNKHLTEMSLDPRFNGNIAQLLAQGEFSEATIINHEGNAFFISGPSLEERSQSLSLAGEALKTGKWSVSFGGRTWGVIWFSDKDLKISAPLSSEGGPLGAVTICASLTPIYEALRKSERVILFYILLDTLILLIVGISLLSRIVVRPIHRLLRMTEEYQGGDTIPLSNDTTRNEIGDLSRSLSTMLKRLEENKKELQGHITSLEKANKELKQAQDEIIRSEKLASVGRLAAGIAHEIGNPLGIILGYVGLIRKGDITEEEKEDFSNRIESELTRINRIIQELLDFSRPANGQIERTHAHDIIKNTLDILRPQPMMDEIRVHLDLRASEDMILADPNQLRQVFFNIMINAVDALSENGSLEGKDPGKEKELIIRSENTSGSIELEFIDNGPGISEKELVRIFDPFYTTKAPGKGTGLGLSVCYRIVEGLGGTTRAESTVGKGTTIVITLPLNGKEKGGR